MDAREDLVSGIVEIEWKMFQNVPNIGGRAFCQDDFKTFQIMRSSQVASWSEETLESYLDDLRTAESSGKNLLTEKYARMMASTSPSEYAQIEHLLAPIDPEAIELIKQISSIVLGWEKELLEKYPNILRKGRPLFSSEDSPMVTSLETYLKGELETYSLRTLQLHLANMRRQRSENINGSAITLLDMMKRYGFNSLEEANQKLNSSF
jgi:hypothetical protein